MGNNLPTYDDRMAAIRQRLAAAPDPHTNAERRVVDLLCTWDRPTLEQLADMLRAQDPLAPMPATPRFIGGAQ